MAAPARRRMSGAEQANLLPSPGVQVPGGLARPLVLALLLASAIMPSGKGGAAAGRAREDGAGPGAERQDGPGQGTGDSECPEQVVVSRGAGSLQPWRGCLKVCGKGGCLKGSVKVGSLRGLRSGPESSGDPGSECVDGRGRRSGRGV